MKTPYSIPISWLQLAVAASLSLLPSRNAPTVALRGLAVVIACVVLFLFTPHSMAQSTWSGSVGASDWATAADWGGTALASGNSINFTSANASTTATLTDDETAPFTVAGITFSAGSPAYTITGNALTLTGAITNSSANTQTINDNISMAATEIFTTDAGGNITVTGTLSGAGGLTTEGTAGVVTLSNDDLTGNLTVGAGAATAAADSLTITGGTFGSSSSTLTIQTTQPAAFEMTGGSATFATVNIATAANNSDGGMVITGGTATFTTTNLGGGSDTGGDLTISGAGTVVALGAYTDGRDEGGGLQIQGGTVTATTFAMTGAGATHGVNTTISGGSLTIGNSTSTGAFRIATGGGLAEDLTVSSGSLTYLGMDGLLLNIAAIPTAVTFSGGTTSLTGITLDDVNSATVGSTLAVKTGATLYLGSVGLNEGSGAITDSGASVTLGTATIGALANWSSAVAMALTSGSTTTFQAGNASNTAKNITLTGVISGAGNVNITGLGTVYLAQTSPNTYTGTTTVSSGTLEFQTLDAQVSTSPGAITVNSGATLAVEIGTGANQFTNGTSGAGTIGGLISTVGFQPASYLGIDTTPGSTSYSGNITNSGLGLTLSGGHTLTLTGANTYSGPTNINAGTLALGSSGPLGNTAITVAGGAALQVTPSLGAVTIGSAGGAALTLAGGSTLVMGSTAETSTFNTLILSGGVTIGGSSPAALTFALNDSSSDELEVSGAVSFGTDGGVISLVVPSASTAPAGAVQTYTLVAAGSGLTSGGFTLASSSQIISLGGISFAASLSETAGTTETLTLSEVTVADYWTGATSSSWSVPGNFSTDHTGAAPQGSQLASTNNVILTADSPSGTHTASQTLDNSYTINSLSFSSTAPAIILGTGSLGNGAANTLTLDGATGFSVTVGASSPVTTNYGAGVGLVMQNGSAAQTLDVPVALGGSQAWEIDSATNALTVQGPISDGGASYSLTKTGVGTLILAGANTYGGGTYVNAGILAMGNGGTLLSTGTLTVEGTGTYDLAGTSQTFNGLADGGVGTGAITSSTGSGVLTLNNGTSNTYSGTITDAGTSTNNVSLSLIFNGPGNVTLSGSNSYNGLTTLNGGNLTLGNNYALGNPTAANGGLTISNSTGTANVYFTSANPNLASLNSTTSVSSNVILGNAAGSGSATTLNVGGAGGISTFTGTISDLSATKSTAVGNLSVFGGGLLILTAANTFTGVTTITGSNASFTSELELQNAGALENSTLYYNNQGGTINFSTLGALTLAGLTGSQNLALTNQSGNAVALTIGNNNGSSIYTGNLGGLGSLIKNGGGTTQLGSGLAGGASYPGTTTINAGTVIIGGTSDLTGAVNLSGAGGTQGLTVQDDAVINMGGATLYMVSAGGTAFPGFGTLLVTGSASVTAGGLSVGNGSRVPTGNSVTVSGLATLTINGTYDLMHDEGSTGANSTTNLNGGTLAVQSITDVGGGTGTHVETFTFNGGTFEALASDGAAAFMPADPNLTANVSTGGAIVNTNGFNITIAQNLLHAGTGTDGGLTKNGAGTLYLTGANSYDGITTLNAGTLKINGEFALGGSGYGGLSFNGGTLQYITSLPGSNGTADITQNSTGTAEPVTDAAGGATIDTNGNAVVYSDTFGNGGSGGLTVTDTQGTGSLTLLAAETYTGATTINPGATLQLGNGTSGDDGTILTSSGITDNGSLIYNRFGATSSSLVISGSGSLQVSGSGSQTLTGANTYTGSTTINPGSTLQLGNGSTGNDGTITTTTTTSGIADNGTLIYDRFGSLTSGVAISGAGNVEMTGTGTQTLTASSNFTGATTVNQGRLIVSGSLTGTTAVSVAGGAHLEVDGMVNNGTNISVTGYLNGTGSVGPVTVASNGTLGPGRNTLGSADAGTLTANGNVVLTDTSSVFSVRLGAGDSDQLALDPGDLVSLNNATLKLTLDPDFAQQVVGFIYVLINGGTATTGDISGEFEQGTQIADTIGDQYNILYNVNASGVAGAGDDVDLQLTAVPEPGTWAMILSGMGLLALWQRSSRACYRPVQATGTRSSS